MNELNIKHIEIGEKTDKSDLEQLVTDYEKRIQEIQKFNLFSNTFLSVVFKDVAACQYVLQILLNDKNLVLKRVETQYVISKISRGAQLDIIAEDEKGNIFNLEIQRSDTVDHPRRLRFYSAQIDGEILGKGTEYSELPEMYILYISETDILKLGKTVYEVRKILSSPEKVYDDGLHICYINVEIQDGSEKAELMHYFKTADPCDFTHGALSERVHFLKCSERGQKIMCEVTDKFFQAGIQQGALQEKMKISGKMAAAGISVMKIADIVGEKAEIVAQWLRDVSFSAN